MGNLPPARRPKRRLDSLLTERGLYPSRSRAAAAVIAGDVHLGAGRLRAQKPGQLVRDDVEIDVVQPPPYVSRGGIKLANALDALDALGVQVAGRRALDVGASTGGFTDCLLQRGAAEVVALDVGHGQLHPRIRSDPRVLVLERTNVRDATPATIGGMVAVVVVDVSFISLAAVIPALVPLCHPGADMVMLVKPQFEAGRVEVSRGRGVITDPAVHDRVRAEVADAIVANGCSVVAWMDSPLRGGDGNREFLVHARAPGQATVA